MIGLIGVSLRESQNINKKIKRDTFYYNIMLPIEIINKILIYISELNNDMMITQYDPKTNKEYYKINFNTDLWKIKATLIMKRIYPIYNSDDYLKTKGFIEVYKLGKLHYDNELRLNTIK